MRRALITFLEGGMIILGGSGIWHYYDQNSYEKKEEVIKYKNAEKTLAGLENIERQFPYKTPSLKSKLEEVGIQEITSEMRQSIDSLKRGENVQKYVEYEEEKKIPKNLSLALVVLGIPLAFIGFMGLVAHLGDDQYTD